MIDFLKLTRPSKERVLAPPREERPEGKEAKDEMRRVCRRALILDAGGWPVDALTDLRQIVERAVHLKCAGRVDYWILWEIIEALQGAKRCRPLSDHSAWRGAVDAAISSLNHRSFRRELVIGSRQATVALALLWLSRKGYPFEIDGHGTRLKRPAFGRLCARLEDKIKRVGGRTVANAALDLMARLGRVEDGSLLHARAPATLAKQPAMPSTPWHFIYNLALKHFDAAPTSKDHDSVLHQMQDLAENLAASSDIEPRNAYENSIIPESGLSRVVVETALYDEFFSFPQWQPLASADFIPGWITSLAEAG